MTDARKAPWQEVVEVLLRLLASGVEAPSTLSLYIQSHRREIWKLMRLTFLFSLICGIIWLLLLATPHLFPQTNPFQEEAIRQLADHNARIHELERNQSVTEALKLDARLTSVEKSVTQIYDQMIWISRLAVANLLAALGFLIKDFLLVRRERKQ